MVVEVSDSEGDVDVLRLPNGLAVVQGLDPSEQLVMPLNAPGDSIEKLRSLMSCQGRPSLEGIGCCCDGLVNLLLSRLFALRQHFFGARIHAGDERARGRGELPLSFDEGAELASMSLEPPGLLLHLLLRLA
eukprot:460437-Hanusia_phi.AAC.1